MILLALLLADLSGIWVGQIPTRNGEFQDVAFKLVQKGAVLEGKLYGDFNSTPISEGKVTGDQVDFVVETSEQAGNQINTTRLRFTGQFKDGKLELTRARERTTNAGNTGGAQVRNSAPQVFTLKRLL
ncbi:MAG: hypothetical protein SFV51_06790 [Bryobacteraceae bacterium]|nr:hypothetical protein [Bryobacteraceae bacterium]